MKPRTLGAAIGALFSASALAADFGNTYFFGDSLTDSGYYAPLLPPGTGRFTTNPGPVWAENVAAAYGRSANPNNAGGTNYAQGGARVTGTPGVGAAPASGAQPVATQITTYLAASGGVADGRALYAVWAGANDVFVAATPGAVPDPAAYIQATAGELVAQIGRLSAAGAKYIVVPTVPDIGATPFGASTGPAGAAGLTALSNGFNLAVQVGLNGAGIRVIHADTFTLLREVIADPATYGFTNVAGTACGATPSLVCTSAALVAPDAAQTYVFADGVHPTTGAHRVLSDYVLSLVEGPRSISLFAETPVKTRLAFHAGIFEQLAVRGHSDVNVWLGGDVGQLKFSAGADLPGAKGTPLALTVGADKRMSPTFVIGGAVGLGQVKPDFTGGGDYTQNEQALALYGGYRDGSLGIRAAAALGNLDFDSHRQVKLGPATRTVTGSTDGSNLSLAVRGDWDMTAGQLSHGPLAQVVVQRVRIEGFTENGGSAGMRYAPQVRQSAIASLGWQFALDAGRYQPWARLTVDRELKKNTRTVNAGVATLQYSSGFDYPAAAPDRSWGTLAAGVSGRLGPALIGHLGLAATVGQKDVRDYRLQVALSAGF